MSARISGAGATDASEEIEDTADMLILTVGCECASHPFVTLYIPPLSLNHCCQGLSRWELPDIPGVQDFKGKLIHTGD